MSARSNSEVVSNLPVWEVRPLSDPDVAIVTCPRCGESVTLTLSAWAGALVTERGHLIVGRPCPYCAKVSRLPE